MSTLQERLPKVLLIAFCIIVSFTIARCFFTQAISNEKQLQHLQIISRNGEIETTWDDKYYPKIKEVIISVSTDGVELLTSRINPSEGGYSFSIGKTNTLYTINICLKYSDGSISETQSIERMFINYGQLPDIMCLDIHTVNGTEPSWNIAEKPIDRLVMGESISNNEYSSAIISILNENFEDQEMIGQVKIRGNTSSALSEKKSYRIKFKKKMDLLNKGDDYAHKEWVLLQNGSNLNTYIGLSLSEMCGLEWTPKMRFVNLFLNGDWKGLYILIEPIEEGIQKLNISDKGFLFEDSAYWWKPNVIYFQTNNHDSQLGYIIHYPKINTEKDSRKEKLQSYLQKIEDYLMNSDKQALAYIDLESFARWMIQKDLLGMDDAGGTNMFYYFNMIDDELLCKLKMGPAWDYDSCFINTKWSKQHEWKRGLYSLLWGYKEYKRAYINTWEGIRKTVYKWIDINLEELKAEEDAIDLSRYMDAVRWRKQYVKLQEESALDKRIIQEKIEWIDRHLDEL